MTNMKIARAALLAGLIAASLTGQQGRACNFHIRHSRPS